MVGLAAVLTSVVLAQMLSRFGPVVVLLPLAGAASWYLLLHPWAALATLVTTTILFEGQTAEDAQFGIPTDRWYQYVGPLQSTDLLLALLAGSILLAVARPSDVDRPRIRLVGGFTTPVLLLAAGIAFGIVTGRAAGADPVEMANAAKPLLYLVLLPFLAVAVLVDRAQRLAMAKLVGVLVVAKSAIGLLAYAAGQSTAFGEDGGLTYLDAPVNHLAVVYLATVLALPFAKAPIPRWVLLGTPVVALCLLLSFRRSFWISVLLALALTLIVASGQRGRPWIALGAVAVVLAIWVTVVGGGAQTSDNPVVQRAQSLDPTAVEQNTGDRYRLEERRNILEELRRHPLTGIGLGVPWTARSPLSEEHVGGRQYAHVVALYLWLKLGPLGAAGYLWLAAATVWAGVRTWLGARDAVERSVALGLAAATVGLMVVELTGSFTGISTRVTVLVAVTVGWLASARADLDEVDRTLAPSDHPTDHLTRSTASS